MNLEQTPSTDLALDLRRAFDQSFAAAPADTRQATERFLAIEIGDDSYALRLAEITGLFADRKVVAIPSHAPDLLGIASFRGVVVPVYDLRIFLGYPAGAWPRWLVLIAPATPVGLAFDRLEGYLDIPPEAVAHDVGSKHARQHVAETLRAGDTVRSIVETASILDTIKRREHSTTA